MDHKDILCFVALDDEGRPVTYRKSLHELVTAIRPEISPENVMICRIYEDGSKEPVALDDFFEKEVPTREEAMEFIERRAKNVAGAMNERERSVAKLLGCMRCDYNDPVEKQVQDYIESAQIVWKDISGEVKSGETEEA